MREMHSATAPALPDVGRLAEAPISLLPPLWGLSAVEWYTLFTAHPNLLIVGREEITAAMLRTLRPALREPVWLTSAEDLSLPIVSPGTLVVQDARRLATCDQARWFEWLSTVDMQIITTTPTP